MNWEDLKSSDFADGKLANAVALVPVGAIEQHGPHLPVGVDAILAEELSNRAAARVKTARVISLPVQRIMASQEHHDFPGTLWVDPEHVIAQLTSLGRDVARTGIKRIAFLNAHGGNVPALQIVCRKLRVLHNMLAVASSWGAPGWSTLPAEYHQPHDIHGGFCETSAMLYLRPDLVDMSLAQDFVSHSREVENTYAHLRILGEVQTGWIARDLHPDGAAGNADQATIEAGEIIVEHCATAFAQLLDDISVYTPGFLT